MNNAIKTDQKHSTIESTEGDLIQEMLPNIKINDENDREEKLLPYKEVASIQKNNRLTGGRRNTEMMIEEELARIANEESEKEKDLRVKSETSSDSGW